MADFGGSIRSLMIEWLMQIGSPTQPASTHWITFYTVDPAGSGASNEITKITRTQHDSWDNNGTADDGEVANVGAGESAAATGGGSENITHFGVWTLVSGGTFLFGGSCTNVTINDGDTVSWADGVLTATIS